MWEKMKMANAINVVRSEEKKKKKRKVSEVPKSTLKNKFNSKKTDTGKLNNKRLVRKPELPHNLEENLSVTV
jgi:hypothetical protein